MMKPTIKTDKYELWHGDCLEVLPLLEAGSIGIVATDPPYGNNYSTGHRKGIIRSETRVSGDIITKPLLNDVAALLEPLLNDVAALLEPLLNDVAALYWFCAPDRLDMVLPIIKKHWKVVNVLCWDKGNCSAGDLIGAYGKQWEACVYAVTEKMPLLGRRDRDVIRESRGDTSGYFHSTQKPVPLMEKLLLKHEPSKVLDCFMGSGTTGVAALKHGRYFIGIESDEKYFEVAAKRLADCASQGMLEFTE